ncbi:MAG: hypothetical protein ABSB68_02925 [Acidimicrobiales bacterium]|jgi:hypothetical protein
MEVKAGFICDAATVREGLLHVLGGAITRLWRPTMPAPLGVTFAMVLSISENELDIPHQLLFTVNGPDGVIGSGMSGFLAPRPDRLEEGEDVLAPVVFPIPLLTNAYGRHSIGVSIDNEPAGRELSCFWVLHPEEQLIPPLS